MLTKRSFGEANTHITLLTKDLGLLRVGARSARMERSKLRYGLETLTAGRFSLLRGRYEWKIVGAEDLSRIYFGNSLAARRASGRVARLLLRLINGEEPVPLLYETAKEGFRYLAEHASDEDVEHIECVLVLRILSHLGYVEQGAKIMPFVSSSDFSEGLAQDARLARPFLIRAINESLSATGL